MKILVVDDEFVSLNKLTNILNSYGECDSFQNPEEAFEQFVKQHELGEPYNLITLDIDMPEMDGKELLFKIKRWEEDQQVYKDLNSLVKVLMVTGMTDSKNLFSAFRKGAEGYLMKPFTPKDVHKALSRLDFEPK